MFESSGFIDVLLPRFHENDSGALLDDYNRVMSHLIYSNFSNN